jgi:hypothetical protein
MKCTKCGFVSFDYLSECTKCGINLSAARDTLGFSGKKSNVPFFLGSLLKEYVKPPAADNKDLTEDSSTPSFDFGDESELNGSFGNAEQAVMTVAAEQTAASASTTEPLETEDFSLLDISDEELDILMAEEVNAPESTSGSQASLSQSADVTGGHKDSLIPRVDLSSLPGLAAKGQESGVSDEPTVATRKDTVDENLVIDLSDMDLENFLSELDDPSEQGDGSGKSAGPKQGKP